MLFQFIYRKISVTRYKNNMDIYSIFTYCCYLKICVKSIRIKYCKTQPKLGLIILKHSSQQVRKVRIHWPCPEIIRARPLHSLTRSGFKLAFFDCSPHFKFSPLF